MKSSAARKYITVHTIKRANQQLMARGRDYEPPPKVRALMPSREVILRAANDALGRYLAMRQQREGLSGLPWAFLDSENRGRQR